MYIHQSCKLHNIYTYTSRKYLYKKNGNVYKKFLSSSFFAEKLSFKCFLNEQNRSENKRVETIGSYPIITLFLWDNGVPLKVLCLWNIGHSTNICLIVSIVLHCVHSGTGSCGVFIKYPCVR